MSAVLAFRGDDAVRDPAVALHLAHLVQRNLRPSTIYQRERALARLTQAHDLLTVTTVELVDHLSRLTHAASRRAEIMHLAGFYRWAHKAGVVETDPTE